MSGVTVEHPGVEALFGNAVADATDTDSWERLFPNQGIDCFTANTEDLHEIIYGIACDILMFISSGY